MKPVKWGILSTANIFTKAFAVPLAQSPLSDLYAISSRSSEKAEVTAAAWNIPHWYGSYEEMLADKAIEAVYNPLPNHMHLEWIKKCADAGKHILCEKPLTMNAAEAEEAIAYTEKKGVLLMEAFMYRLHPQWRHVREIIATGNIGDITAVQSFFSYSNNDPDNIRNIAAYGGGGLYDIGCYTISSARFAFGREPSRVISLVNRDPAFDTDVLTSGIMDFGTGHATFTISTKTFPEQYVTVTGTDGKLHVEIPFNIHPDVPVTVTVTTGVGVRTVSLGPADQYRLEVDAFSEAVRNGGPVPTQPSDALANMRVIDAFFASEKSGGWETVADSQA